MDAEGATTATRDVEEEAGWRPDPLEHLASLPTNARHGQHPHDAYLARAAEKVGEPTDAEEAARGEWMPLSRVLDLVTKGEIVGSGSLAGLL